jgi:hypothetical protein
MLQSMVDTLIELKYLGLDNSRVARSNPMHQFRGSSTNPDTSIRSMCRPCSEKIKLLNKLMSGVFVSRLFWNGSPVIFLAMDELLVKFNVFFIIVEFHHLELN